MKQPAISDEQIIAALLANGTIGKAAEAAGIAPRTIYKRMGTPQFRAAYIAARADLVRGAVADLNGHLAEAVNVIAEIMTDPEAAPTTRLQAAKLLLQSAARFTDRLAEADTATADALQSPII